MFVIKSSEIRNSKSTFIVLFQSNEEHWLSIWHEKSTYRTLNVQWFYLQALYLNFRPPPPQIYKFTSQRLSSTLTCCLMKSVCNVAPVALYMESIVNRLSLFLSRGARWQLWVTPPPSNLISFQSKCSFPHNNGVWVLLSKSSFSSYYSAFHDGPQSKAIYKNSELKRRLSSLSLSLTELLSKEAICRLFSLIRSKMNLK